MERLEKKNRWKHKPEPMSYKQIAKAYAAAKNNFKATLQKAQAIGMSAAQGAQLQADVTKSGKIGAALSVAKEYIAQLEEKIKSHSRRPSDGQPPPDAVIIPPLTAEQYAAIKNWHTAAQVGAVILTEGTGVIIGAIIGFKVGGLAGSVAGGVVGAIVAGGWGAYEASCIASVQDEFDEAYQQGSGVTVWRDGWRYNVDANSGDGMYTQANGPLSALYAAATTSILTGKTP